MDSKAKRVSRPVPPAEPPEAPAEAGVDAAESVLAAPKADAKSKARQGADLAREAYEAFAHSQEVLARCFEALGLEMVGLARSGIDRAAKTASEMLAVKTLSDAVDVNAGFARDSFDCFVEGSTRLSELGFKYAREAAQPLLAQWQKDWAKAFWPAL